MNFKKHMEKYGRLYKLEIYLLVLVIILGAFSYFVRGPAQFYLYIVFFYLASWFFTVIPIELILVNISEKTKTKIRRRFKKKPKVFEYAFFLGLFWATAMMTMAYSQEIGSGLDFFKFLNTFGFSIFFYGFASACGWYHYVERLDDD